MNYRIAYAATRGSAHISQGIPCQDITDGWCGPEGAAIVLADGAGFSPHSHHGAQAVVAAAKMRLTDWCREGLPDDIQAREQLFEVCTEALKQEPYDIDELACTLLGCAVDSEGNYLCIHIGDGYIFRVFEKGAELLSDAEQGEQPNETVFLTSEDAIHHLRFTRGQMLKAEGILLCSDGAGESLYERWTRICAPAVERIGQWLREYSKEEVSAAIADNMDQMLRKNTIDDMSIAVLIAYDEEADRDVESDAFECPAGAGAEVGVR